MTKKAAKKTVKKKVKKKAVKVQDPSEVKKLRRQMARLNLRIADQVSGSTIICDAMQEAFRNISYKVPKVNAPKKDRRKLTEEIAILHISDTQIGKVTASYNTIVAAQRIESLIDKTMEITEVRRQYAKIEEIHVFMGGDMVEGEQIFAHQAHQIDQGVFDQAYAGAEMLRDGMVRLLAYFKKVKIICVKGNHGRNGPKKGPQHPRTNWDTVCYSFMEMLLGKGERGDYYKDRLEFIISESFYYVDYTYKWGHFLVHGDQITGGAAGFPWPGVAKKIFKWSDCIPQPWDYIWMGHFHTMNMSVMNTKILLANGTTESDSNFALEQLAAAGTPVQRLTFFNDSKGLIADHPVYLEDERLSCSTRYARALENV